MKGDVETIVDEATMLKKIDEQLKGLSTDVRAEAFRIMVERHLGKPASKTTPKVRPFGTDGVKRRGSKSISHMAIVKDLDLKKDGKVPALRDFYNQKKPAAFTEQNAVFVFYLDRLKGQAAITPDHVFTCYKEVAARVPGAFYQSLLDTARKKGWIDTSDTNQLRITTVGENFVEHDLPRQGKD